MSDERKEQRPFDSDFPGEGQLTRLYREGSTETPPAHLDAAILAAARQAVRSRPRQGYFFSSRKWVVPLSLAAALLVSLGLVRSLRQEAAIPQPLGSSAPILPSPYEGRDKRPKQMESQTGETRPATDTLQKAAKDSQERRETQFPRMLTQLPRPSETNVGSTPETVRNEREREAESPRRAARLQSQEYPAATSAPALEATRAKREETTRAEVTLSPEAWLAKITELRRTGKTAEAEASLKAFKERYPEYPAEKVLQGQSGALHTPKE
jgi:hypothetical protein